jgi:hypothetical protein
MEPLKTHDRPPEEHRSDKRMLEKDNKVRCRFSMENIPFAFLFTYILSFVGWEWCVR